MMRVIAGTARGKNLAALPGEDVTRPTINRVKEAMFSSVQFSVPGARVLDLFAGSGQLGIEALSRGAKRCVFLDASREAIQIVLANCKTAGVFAQSRVIPDDADGLHIFNRVIGHGAAQQVLKDLILPDAEACLINRHFGQLFGMGRTGLGNLFYDVIHLRLGKRGIDFLRFFRIGNQVSDFLN